MSIVNGPAKVLFIPPVDGKDRFARLHCIVETDNSVVEINGKLIEYTDPNHNDCMVPDSFYELCVVGNDKQTIIVRRNIGNDAAGFFTHPNEDHLNQGLTCEFETHYFIPDQKACEHAQKYVPQILVNMSKDDTRDMVLCVGELMVPGPR
ncbi:hypothetical protein CLU79DRAFT_830544 [Phycomyces nitens]|nr:hypothetical protein CLU79DRAFT_830544 [Phycomyces nitens]